MNCVSFPDLFTANSTNIYRETDATRICLFLLLNSESGELFGDPDFGVKLKRYFYNQNNDILQDVIIDEIYNKITIFCPQIIISRNDIKLISYKTKIYGSITYKNDRDFTTDTYNIVLFEGE